MTRELIIEGQHVDLSPDTDITLEYVSNVLGDFGKISLSRSYTVKLPRTLRNSRILDDPGCPGHESSGARRFLTARYYRYGIDLLGDAQAYILRITPEAYELALVWNTLPALQALSQSKKTLNDLAGLSRLTWIGSNGQTPDYSGMQEGSVGALFAWYESGLGQLHYPDVNAATHPAMSMDALLRMIMEQAGVPYTIESERAQAALWSCFLLAAPSHKPDAAMEIYSGSAPMVVKMYYEGTSEYSPVSLSMTDWAHGWDATSDAQGRSYRFNVGDNPKHRVLLNFKAPAGLNLAGAYVRINAYYVEGNTSHMGFADQAKVLFQESDSGWYCSADLELNLNGWMYYDIRVEGYDATAVGPFDFAPLNLAYPVVASYRVHDAIDIAQDNRFPLEGNLPDIGQWEFVTACMSMFGMVPVIKDGAVAFVDYGILFDKSQALEWTHKVAMNADGSPDEFSPSADGWAQSNLIVFAENEEIADPTADIRVSDATLKESRDLFKLPFAASRQSSAIHYEVGKDNELEDIDIEPRVFRLSSAQDDEGNTRSILTYTDDLSGEGLVRTYFPELQEAMRKPVRLSVGIRLHELDLARLDFRRPVYLGQWGQYYSIIKIQTSDTDLCKVELIQIP